MSEPRVVAPADPHTRPSPRWLVILVVTLLAAATLAVIGWQTVARSYAVEPRIADIDPNGAVADVVDGVSEFRFLMAKGATYRFAVPVHNPGPLPVRVTGFGGADPFEWPYSVYPIIAIDATRQDDAGRELDPLSPFAPVVLNPHETLLVFITMRLVGDRAAGAACRKDWIEAMPVRYTVLGVDREQMLPLEPRIAFQAGTDCPDH
jgi:hypothetical protein